mgnify:FL=1
MIEDKIKYSNIKNFYFKLPSSLQKIVGMFYSITPTTLKYGKYYKKNQNDLIKILNNKSFYEKLIKQKLVKTLFIAKHYIPFYIQELKSVRDEEIENSPYEILKSLPYISKDQVKNNKEAFLNVNYKNERKIAKTTTSGSTGSPMQVFYEVGKTKALELSTLHYFWKYFFNISPRDLSVTIRGNVPKSGNVYEYEPVKNSIIINPNKITKKYLEELVKVFSNKKIKYIEAYPSNMKLLTDLFEEHIKNLNLNLKGILLGSEVMMPTQRIENYWKAPVYSWYGHSENVLIAPWDSEKNYIFFEHIGIVEFEKIAKNLFEIVGSSIDNEIWVLLNYRTGDLATDVKFRNGTNHFSSCKNIIGRKSYIAKNAYNEQVSIGPLLFGLHDDLLNLIEDYQLIQTEVGKLKIIIKIPKNYKLESKQKKTIERLFAKKFENFELNFDYNGEIIQNKNNGKKDLFISLLNYI